MTVVSGSLVPDPFARATAALAERSAARPRNTRGDGAALVAAAFGARAADCARVARPPRAVRRVPRARRGGDAAPELLGACREVVAAALVPGPDGPRPHGRRHSVPAAPVDGPPLSRAAAAPAIAPAGSRSHAPARPSSRIAVPVRRAVHVALYLVGLAVGLAWGLPLDDVDARCPPRGEGFGQCYLQKSILPATMLILAPLLAARMIGVLVTDTVPRWRTRWRAGERPTRMTTRQETPPYDEDPLLLAASWGVRTGRDGR